MKKRYVTGAAAILLAVAIAGCGNGARSSGGSDIGKDEAQRIAMEDAGVSESEVSRLRVSQDQEDGRSSPRGAWIMNMKYWLPTAIS